MNCGDSLPLIAPPNDGAQNGAQNLHEKKLQEKGEKIFKMICEKYPDWNEVDVQEKIINEIDRCSRNKIDLNTKAILDYLSARFTVKDDIQEIPVQNNAPPSDYEITGDIVDAWFIENYVESPVQSMSIYKKELYEEFLSQFDLRFRLDLSEILQNFQIFSFHRIDSL